MATMKGSFDHGRCSLDKNKLWRKKRISDHCSEIMKKKSFDFAVFFLKAFKSKFETHLSPFSSPFLRFFVLFSLLAIFLKLS